MIFTETRLPGAFIIEPELRGDERGFFAPHLVPARVRRARPESPAGAVQPFGQPAAGHSARACTTRPRPTPRPRWCTCVRGAIYDVIVDLRAGSPTFKEWLAVELTAANRRMLYVPEGFAHGFQTLADDSEVFYQMSEFYVPEAARGVRWNDPAFGIRWPLPVTAISERDRSFEDFAP